jgi:hypothetical protein
MSTRLLVAGSRIPRENANGRRHAALENFPMQAYVPTANKTRNAVGVLTASTTGN